MRENDPTSDCEAGSPSVGDTLNNNNNNNNNTTTTITSDCSCDENPEIFCADIHKRLLNLKNTKPVETEKKKSDQKSNTSLLRPVIGFLQILVDWVVDFVVAGHHFFEGRYYVGGLTLFFVFVGGAFVTFDLNLLTRRKGHREFKEMLRKISPIILCLTYVPSFLPFFSSGLTIYLINKLRKTSDETETKKLQRQIKICKEHCVIDTYYECCYESFGQATLQLVILLEKPEYTSIMDFVPLLGVLSAWNGISTAPIQIAKTLNNHQGHFTEVIAGLANKGVTLLSFALVITSSRQYFAKEFLETVDHSTEFSWNLILATVIPVVVLTIFADLPGILLLHKEVNSKKRHVHKNLEYLMNLISLTVPVAAIVFWSLVLSYSSEELDMPRYFVVTGIFMTGFVAAFVGYFCNEDLPWLGQFDTDILLLLYIGITSFIRGNEFQDMDYQFSVTLPQDASSNKA